MRKYLILFALFTTMAQAQTSIQLFYDFGSKNTACTNQREQQLTATIEHLSFDNCGSNFFFVDMDFAPNGDSPFCAYLEYARTFNFWQTSKAKDLSLHVEYNGGLALGYGISHTILGGLEYQLHSDDYRHFITFMALARYTPRVTVPLQGTVVWGCEPAKGLSFSGFLDLYESEGLFAFMSEPQLWYNIGKHIKMPQLHIGAEIELSYNFAGRGFMCNPCIGFKWVV